MTTFTYQNSPPMKKAETNGKWSKTWYDGIGRTIKVEPGHGSTAESVVETEYVFCACSAAGKVAANRSLWSQLLRADSI